MKHWFNYTDENPSSNGNKMELIVQMTIYRFLLYVARNLWIVFSELEWIPAFE